MPKFIRDVLIFCGINIAILGYLFAIYDLPADYFAAVNENFDRLEVKKHPQILFVGGSSVAWSNHSQLVKDAFPEYEVENLAYHAGLGLGLRLEEARVFSKKGDVVVISIEWGVFKDEPTPRIMSEAVLACPRIFSLMDARDRKIVCDGLLAAIKMPFASFITIAKSEKLKALTYEAAQSRKGFRLRKNFNDLGDFEGHYDQVSPGIEGKQVELSTKEKLLDGVDRLNELHDELEARGVRLVYFIPIVAEQGYLEERERMDNYLKLVRKKLKSPILNPTEFFYPNDSFFDSCYHMKYEAGLRRTKMLTSALKNVLNDAPSDVSH